MDKKHTIALEHSITKSVNNFCLSSAKIDIHSASTASFCASSFYSFFSACTSSLSRVVVIVTSSFSRDCSILATSGSITYLLVIRGGSVTSSCWAASTGTGYCGSSIFTAVFLSSFFESFSAALPSADSKSALLSCSLPLIDGVFLKPSLYSSSSSWTLGCSVGVVSSFFYW